MSIAELPEIAALGHRQQLVRIPPEQDVPITDRVRRMIDTAAFRRLARISQLGLVSQVYPAAHHTRFEHSLGTYRLSLLYLNQLLHVERFADCVSVRDAELFVLATLVHDIGHWPFCHLIEDLCLPDLPAHENLAAGFLQTDEITELLQRDWNVTAAELMRLLAGPRESQSEQLLGSLLSGPIDVDKMDYLSRDSLHAGVPYGRHFDRQRLIGSLCVNEAGNGLAITDKGRTAAEMMVFARYVMFSEVYWHHAVRSATAMFQRSFYRLLPQLDLDSLFLLEEQPFQHRLLEASAGSDVRQHLEGLFGARRQLFKRWTEYSLVDNSELYTRLARQPYPWLCQLSEQLAEILSSQIDRTVRADDILVDVPPQKLEVEFNVPVHYPKQHRYCMLGDVSPVVQTLAQRQFDDHVKRVRIFVEPGLAGAFPTGPAADEAITTALEAIS